MGICSVHICTGYPKTHCQYTYFSISTNQVINTVDNSAIKAVDLTVIVIARAFTVDSWGQPSVVNPDQYKIFLETKWCNPFCETNMKPDIQLVNNPYNLLKPHLSVLNFALKCLSTCMTTSILVLNFAGMAVTYY